MYFYKGLKEGRRIYKKGLSKGECYKHKKSRIPVRYLTAADENLITSPNMYANGTLVEKVVGTNYGVAVFKVTFSSGHKLKLKVYLDDGQWYGLEPHKYI